MQADDRKRTALNFLRSARIGDRIGAREYVTPNARHHNPYFAKGMTTLLDAITAAATPERVTDIKRVLCDGDIVAVHSHVRQRPGDSGAAVVHLFRFEGDKIAELWDVGQPVPVDNPNADGMF
jgi:predicted SnoaL-like aldol condensation-catalyzing enzyme